MKEDGHVMKLALDFEAKGKIKDDTFKLGKKGFGGKAKKN